jgi:Ran GTPase-activating protein (RanGAP) involved in mRNA processing and transport
MQESRHLKTLHLIGMKFSREAFSILGDGIAKAKSLKKLIINQSNIGTYGLQELAAGFASSSSVEYLDLQCNDLNDSHGYQLAKIVSTQFEMRDNLKWKLGLRLP